MIFGGTNWGNLGHSGGKIGRPNKIISDHCTDFKKATAVTIMVQPLLRTVRFIVRNIAS